MLHCVFPSLQVLITWNSPELAHKLAKVTEKMFMVEDTLLGYTLNDITWCGQEKKPYVNFERCPLQFLCEGHPMDSFFAAATKIVCENNKLHSLRLLTSANIFYALSSSAPVTSCETFFHNCRERTFSVLL